MNSKNDVADLGFQVIAFKLDFATTDTKPTVTLVADSSVAASGINAAILRRAMRWVAGYASAPYVTSSPSGLLQTVQVDVPEFRRIGLPYLRPLAGNQATATVLPGPDPNLHVSLYDGPIVPPGEPLTIQAVRRSAISGSTGVVLLWLAYGINPLPPGEAFNIEYTSNTDAGVTPLTWAPLTLTWTSSLPSGRYAIVGMEHSALNALAARLVLPEGPRAGVLAQDKLWERTHRIFYEGELGVYGYFDSPAMPNIEALATTGSTDHRGYLRIIRIGDVGCPCH